MKDTSKIFGKLIRLQAKKVNHTLCITFNLTINLYQEQQLKEKYMTYQISKAFGNSFNKQSEYEESVEGSESEEDEEIEDSLNQSPKKSNIRRISSITSMDSHWKSPLNRVKRISGFNSKKCYHNFYRD